MAFHMPLQNALAFFVDKGIIFKGPECIAGVAIGLGGIDDRCRVRVFSQSVKRQLHGR